MGSEMCIRDSAMYGITQPEIDFIEKVVRPMDLSADLLGDVVVDGSDDE